MTTACQQIGRIIRQCRAARSWTLAQLAEAAGCSKAYLSEIENARHENPPGKRLLEALEAALEITPGELQRLADWQKTPPRVRDHYERLAQLAGRRHDGSVNLDAMYHSGALRRRVEGHRGNVEAFGGVCVEVPLINQVAAGYPRDFTDLDFPARVADEYVSCAQVGDGDSFAARVVGDSMEPAYHEGDIIVFAPSKQPSEGADCFVRLLPDHETTFKRVFSEPNDHVRLQPLNAKYEPRVVPVDQVDGIFPAVYRMQRLGGG